MKKVYTKYERARIIGARALQISMGAPMLLKMNKEELEKINYSPVEIAKKEFETGVIPITIRRPLPGRTRE
ncbi:MAG: DNA-directed RNA polymerase subunit K [Candidatus Nanoarchaeia archaeon]|nr:DNA-directed RNA polymerase subunit K [Candidatus Nanoarchaeia archaeon]